MPKENQLSEREIRNRLKAARIAFEHQLADKAADLGRFVLGLHKSGRSVSTKVGGKQGALTAMHEELSLRLALIEFIDQLDLDGKNKSTSIKEVLHERHVGIVLNLERSGADVATKAADIITACTQARDEGWLVPFGEKARHQLAGDHARLMKDIAIVGFIQQFGVISRSRRTNK